MDEPAAAPGVRETAQVPDFSWRLRGEGRTVSLVSHAMPDVVAVADRAMTGLTAADLAFLITSGDKRFFNVHESVPDSSHRLGENTP